MSWRRPSKTSSSVRCDRYVSGPLALFLGVSGLHDRFQGLDLRLNVDPGVAYYLIDEKVHRLWPELGYDFKYDRRQETIEDAEATGQDALGHRRAAQRARLPRLRERTRRHGRFRYRHRVLEVADRERELAPELGHRVSRGGRR